MAPSKNRLPAVNGDQGRGTPSVPRYDPTAKLRLTRQPFVAAIVLIMVVSCRPSEPAPSYNEDLGTDGAALLPTASAWYDPAVVKGSADWRPFRKPGSEAKADGSATGEAKPTGGNANIESELRTLVNDFNAALADGKFEDAIDFLIEEQVAPSKQVVEFLPTVWGKVKELAEVLPGDNENLKKAVSGLSLAAVLKLDVASITISNPTEAVGKLAPSPGGAVEVRFVRIKEEDGEYWYVDHPEIKAIAAALPMLQQTMLQLDAFIAGVKSGQIGGEALAQQAAMMNQMIGQMLPPASPTGAEPAKGEPAKDAKPEEGSGE